MRIVGGTARGVKLFCPKGLAVRPISDRAREALFNMLGDALERGDFLDLFAGTGSVGIESLSRGAPRAVFVEKNRRHVETLRRNLSKADLNDRATVIHGDAFKAAPRLGAENRRFAIVFLGPPYKLLEEPRSAFRFRQLLRSLAEKGLLLPQCLIVMQSPPKESLSELAGEATIIDRRVYGDVALTFMRLGDGEAFNINRGASNIER